MPFITENQTLLTDVDTGILNSPEQQPVTEEEPNFLDTLSASFQLDNSIASFLNREADFPSKSLEHYNFDYLEKATREGYEDSIDSFFNVDNDKAYQAVVRQVEKERVLRKTVQESGIASALAASLIVGVVDPINAIPLGVGFRAFKAGESLGKTFLRTSASVAPSVVTSEAILSSTQELRDTPEVVANIAAGTLMGGVLGTAGIKGLTALQRKVLAKSEKDLDKYLAESPTGVISDDPVSRQMNELSEGIVEQERLSTSAAKSPFTTIEQESIWLGGSTLQSGAIKTNLNTIGKLSLSTRLLQDDLLPVRKIVQDLTDVSLDFAKNKEGIITPDSVVSNIRAQDGKYAIALQSHNNIWKQYRKAVQGKEVPLNQLDFNKEVGKAMRRKDTHENKFIDQAAKTWRKEFYDPLVKEAIDVGLLPPDVKREVAYSYINRMYLTEEIKARRPEWNAKVKNHFQSMYHAEKSKLQKVINNPSKDINDYKGASQLVAISKMKPEDAITEIKARANEDLNTYLSDMDSFVEEATNNTTDKILGFDSITEIARISPFDRGPFKELTFKIDDFDIEDFLENDITELANRFMRVAVPDTELMRKFGTTKFSAEDTNNPLVKDIIDSKNELLKTAKTEAERLEIENKAAKSIKEVGILWDLVRGRYHARKAGPDDLVRRWTQGLRDYNYITSMGGVVISSSIDPLIIARSSGYSRFFKASLSSALNSDLRKLSKKQALRFGKAANVVISNRHSQLFDLGDYYTKGTAFERGLGNTSKKAGNIFLINFWNDFWESTSGLTNQMHIMDNVNAFVKSGKLDEKELTYMSSLGLDQNTMKTIADEFSKHGELLSNDIPILNTDLWDNKEIARIVNAALNKAVSAEIIVKSPGDAPVFAEGSVGKTFTQFMSFGFAANNKLALKGLQRADRNWLITEINFVLAASLLEGVRRYVKGEEFNDNNDDFVYSAFKNHPEMMIPMYIGNLVGAAGFGVRQNKQGEYYIGGSFNKGRFLTTLEGPSAGKISAGFETLGFFSRLTGISKGANGKDIKPTERQIRQTYSMVPFNNVFYLQRLKEAVIEETIEATDAKRTKKRKK